MPKSERDRMELTPYERKELVRVKDLCSRATHPSTTAEASAAYLQDAEDSLRRITRRQFWSTR